MKYKKKQDTQIRSFPQNCNFIGKLTSVSRKESGLQNIFVDNCQYFNFCSICLFFDKHPLARSILSELLNIIGTAMELLLTLWHTQTHQSVSCMTIPCYYLLRRAVYFQYHFSRVSYIFSYHYKKFISHSFGTQRMAFLR